MFPSWHSNIIDLLIPIIILFFINPPATQSQTSAEHRVVYTEVDGVPLVRTEGGPKYDGPLFELTSDLILGIDDGEPEWQIFGGITEFLVNPDGRMILLDTPRLEVFIISPEGELLLRTGRKGSGPGEFQRMMFLRWFETGSIFQINDRLLNRVTQYSDNGEYLDTINYFHAERYNPQRPRQRWENFVPLGNGQILSRYLESGENSITNPYYLLDSEFNKGEELIRLTSYDQFYRINNRSVIIPFTRLDALVPFPDGRFLTTHPSLGRITVYTSDGDPVLHIERDWTRKRLTSDDRKAVIERYQRSPYEEIKDHPQRAPMPQRYPFFSTVITDDRSRIWVQQVTGYTAAENIYDVFSPDGVWLGTQVFPFRPSRIRGDYVYRRYSSDAGAPRFERLRLIPIIPDLAGKNSY